MKNLERHSDIKMKGGDNMHLLDKSNVILSTGLKDKNELFKQLAIHMAEMGKIEHSNLQAFEEGLWERERLSVTGIGFEIAIPHIQSNIVKDATLVFLKSETEIEYESLDGDYARLVFMIAVPKDTHDLHLKCLAKLSRTLMNEEFRESLLISNNRDELYKLLSNACDL